MPLACKEEHFVLALWVNPLLPISKVLVQLSFGGRAFWGSFPCHGHPGAEGHLRTGLLTTGARAVSFLLGQKHGHHGTCFSVCGWTCRVCDEEGEVSSWEYALLPGACLQHQNLGSICRIGLQLSKSYQVGIPSSSAIRSQLIWVPTERPF